ncbi:hypothetical protein [Azospirillum sp. B510]|uniref:hypothetical protein n=1 Tax=Azospirillum sp. (strain B510) TaxID=137722 RepID=UPI0002F8D280|nr:hypothetical protein [Azospirillum sp. B510]
MSVFNVVADGQSGLFKLQQAKKPWEKELEAKDAKGQLAQKAERAQALTQLSAKWQSDHASAQAALEEARRVGGPKAAAAARLEQVERRIEELKLAMRFAQGDPQKLAALARQAAQLAREAGRAAKEYGAGIKAAADMGLPGDSAAGGGMLSSETTITRSTTSLTLQQTEVTLTIGISTGEGTSAADSQAAGGSAEGAAIPITADVGAQADGAAETAGQEGKLPGDIDRLVRDVLSGLDGGGLAGASPPVAGAAAGSGGRNAMIQQLMADNAMKMSRYREADAFGQRVEKVLAASKRIIGEAKAANMLDESEKRRRERREGFKADDKMVDAAQKEVNALRAAAFGSGDALGVTGLLARGDPNGDAQGRDTAGISAVSSLAGSAAQPAAALDLLA